jgi:hypothetical protein
MERVRIGIAVYSYSLDTHATCSAHDAACNLAAICDEDFAQLLLGRHAAGHTPENFEPKTREPSSFETSNSTNV